MKRALMLVVGLLVFPAWAAAGSWWLGANVASYHTDRSKPYNERNLGPALEYSWDGDYAVNIGTYENSAGRTSRYVLGRITPVEIGPVHTGIFVGLADGYRSEGFNPYGGLALTVEGRRLGANVIAVPYSKGAVFGLQLKLRF